MTRGAWILVVIAGLILAIFGAGFCRPLAGANDAAPCSPERRPARVSVAESPVAAGFCAESGDSLRAAPRPNAWVAAQKPAAGGGLLGLAASPNCRRAADLSVKVEDCTRAEDALEEKLQAVKGEILEMVMEGTEGSRTCTLSALIPANKFREFVADLRKMGKVQAERITASKLKPAEANGSGAPDGKDAPDPRELSLVSIRMADEKVAPNVLESRGLLASSFDQSASHFMNGLAVLVEAMGYVLPYAIALAAVLLPLVVILRARRAREVRMES